MVWGSTRGRLAAALVVAGCLSLSPSVASAGTDIFTGSNPLGTSHGLDYRSASSTDVPSMTAGAAAAYCPNGKRLTGGAAVWSGAIADGYIDDSGPFGFDGHSAKVQWKGSGYNQGAGNEDLNTYAICTAAGGLKLESKSIAPTNSGGTKSKRVKCPQGTLPTGGGVVIGPAEASQLLKTSPWDSNDPGGRRDDGWEVRFYVNLAATQDDITAYAICSESLSLAYRKSEATLVDAGNSAVLTAECKHGEALVGGGAGIFGPVPGAFLNGMAPNDRDDGNLVPDDALTAYAHVAAGPTRTAQAYAVCKK